MFQTLYKSQVKELKEEIEEKIKKIEELKQELSNLQDDRYLSSVYMYAQCSYDISHYLPNLHPSISTEYRVHLYSGNDVTTA